MSECHDKRASQYCSKCRPLSNLDLLRGAGGEPVCGAIKAKIEAKEKLAKFGATVLKQLMETSFDIGDATLLEYAADKCNLVGYSMKTYNYYYNTGIKEVIEELTK